MPQAATANMLLVKPTEGSDAGLWDFYLNALIDLIDAHDHSTGKGVKVKTNGLDINADLTLTSGGTASAITNAKAIDFSPSASAGMTAYAGALFCNSADNELYWRTTGGTNVKLTSGTALNVAAFVGGIGGDYAAIPAECNFVDASKTYTFKSTAGGNWSRLQAGALRIVEFGTTESTYVELACPAALAGTYTVTFPTAAPGSTSIVQMSSAGVLTASNTIGNAVTLSATCTAAAITASGLITANAGVTLGSGQNVTLSGTGSISMSGTGTITCAGAVTATDHKFTTTQTFQIHGSCACVPSASAPTYTVNDTTGAANWSFSAGNRLAVPVNMLRTGDRITGWAIRADSTIGGSATLDVKLWKATSTSAPSQVSTTLSHTNTTTDQTRTGVTETVDAGEEFHFTIRHSAGAGTPDFQCLFLTIDRP